MNLLYQMLDLLTWAYRKTDEYNAENGLPMVSRIGQLFSVFSWGLEIIRENAELVRGWVDIDQARGRVLDRYGKNYGVARGGANDLFYRLMIRTKVLSQLSGGDIETIIAAVSGLYGVSAEKITLNEIFPAKVQVELPEDALPPGYLDIRDLVGEMTKRILAASVGIDMILLEEDATNGLLHLGSRVVSEFTRIRLENYTEFESDLTGSVFIGSHAVSEFTRIRIPNKGI